MGKDRCAVFGCNNDRLFPEKCTVKYPKYTVKDHTSNAKLVLASVTDRAHAPWASHNTP